LVVGGGLAGEGLGEHLLREDVAHLEEYRFEFGELGSPGEAGRAVELIGKVFAHALDIGPYLFHLRGALFG
jgi:hypothetical protein